MTGTSAPAIPRTSIPVARLGGLVCLLLAAECAANGDAPPLEAPRMAVPPAAAVTVERASSPAAPSVKASAAEASAAEAPAAKAPQAVPAPAAVAKPSDPPLDLKSLEARLRETKAIGVFTKLTVKNQIDDLLDRFREFYRGRLKTSLTELRQAFERLVLKVLALLQDADPPLAHAVAASRESIWGILSSPEKFSTL
ncbi:MAG: hypothetical protein Q7S90_06685 [Rubrivivax sp.]|nr:hypothetical protein [Rubrivivax sp.]